jgi:GxxExxY protein
MDEYIPSNKEELGAKKIVDAAYNVHKNLGPGLLEKIYSSCWIIVFTKFLI